jgi:phosphoribosylglycinamide formyltransferase-1
MKRYVILISGRGSNMESLLDAGLPGTCAAVVSNRPEAAGLALAAARGIATVAVDHRGFAAREDFDAALAAEIERHAPDLVLLAGFMRILTDGFVRRFEGRLLNIHPSLLPAFPGIKTHARALAAGVRVHGCSVHFVTPALDGGPIIAQAAVPVLPGDDEAALATRVLRAEHQLYPLALRLIAQGKVRVEGEHVIVTDAPASDGIMFNPAIV